MERKGKKECNKRNLNKEESFIRGTYAGKEEWSNIAVSSLIIT